MHQTCLPSPSCNIFCNSLHFCYTIAKFLEPNWNLITEWQKPLQFDLMDLVLCYFVCPFLMTYQFIELASVESFENEENNFSCLNFQTFLTPFWIIQNHWFFAKPSRKCLGIIEITITWYLLLIVLEFVLWWPWQPI